jgi:hypothetical protein
MRARLAGPPAGPPAGEAGVSGVRCQAKNALINSCSYALFRYQGLIP